MTPASCTRSSVISRRRPRRGMSLLEAVTVLGITVGMIVTMMSMYLFVSRMSVARSLHDEMNGARLVIERRIPEVMLQATSVVAQRDIEGVIHESGKAAVVLSIPALDAAGNAVIGTHDHAVLFVDPTDGSRLILGVEPGPASFRTPEARTVLSRQLDRLEVTYDASPPSDAGTVSFSIVLTGRSAHAEETMTIDRVYALVND